MDLNAWAQSFMRYITPKIWREGADNQASLKNQLERLSQQEIKEIFFDQSNRLKIQYNSSTDTKNYKDHTQTWEALKAILVKSNKNFVNPVSQSTNTLGGNAIIEKVHSIFGPISPADTSGNESPYDVLTQPPAKELVEIIKDVVRESNITLPEDENLNAWAKSFMSYITPKIWRKGTDKEDSLKNQLEGLRPQEIKEIFFDENSNLKIQYDSLTHVLSHEKLNQIDKDGYKGNPTYNTIFEILEASERNRKAENTASLARASASGAIIPEQHSTPSPSNSNTLNSIGSVEDEMNTIIRNAEIFLEPKETVIRILEPKETVIRILGNLIQSQQGKNFQKGPANKLISAVLQAELLKTNTDLSTFANKLSDIVKDDADYKELQEIVLQPNGELNTAKSIIQGVLSISVNFASKTVKNKLGTTATDSGPNSDYDNDPNNLSP